MLSPAIRTFSGIQGRRETNWREGVSSLGKALYAEVSAVLELCAVSPHSLDGV